MADVIGADNARQFPRCLKHKAVVEHLYLYLGALDAVVAVANRIYRHLLYHELGIFPVSLEKSVLTKIGVFFHLGFEVVNGFLYLVEDTSLEGDIFDNIHLPTHFLFRTVILDEAHSGTGKEVLRTLAEKQNAGSADFKSLVMPEKALTSPPK